MSLQYRVVPVTSFQQNCSIVWCDETLEAIVVDPGGEVTKLEAVIRELGVKVVKVVLTHGHLDHVGGAEELAKSHKVDIIGPHRADDFWLKGLEGQSQMFGFPLTKAFEPSAWLNEGDVVTFGHETLAVFHTPGHSPGHVILHNEASQTAFTGDVLFSGGVGRTDFPQGNFDVLIRSIKEKLWPLGNEVTFIPGHGEASTFGRERKTNPFVADEMPI
jgi:glyoxylase-like metal-dependent hydrolase (beta-lactamase superfamily II)